MASCRGYALDFGQARACATRRRDPVCSCFRQFRLHLIFWRANHHLLRSNERIISLNTIDFHCSTTNSTSSGTRFKLFEGDLSLSFAHGISAPSSIQFPTGSISSPNAPTSGTARSSHPPQHRCSFTVTEQPTRLRRTRQSPSGLLKLCQGRKRKYASYGATQHTSATSFFTTGILRERGSGFVARFNAAVASRAVPDARTGAARATRLAAVPALVERPVRPGGFCRQRRKTRRRVVGKFKTDFWRPRKTKRPEVKRLPEILYDTSRLGFEARQIHIQPSHHHTLLYLRRASHSRACTGRISVHRSPRPTCVDLPCFCDTPRPLALSLSTISGSRLANLSRKQARLTRRRSLIQLSRFLASARRALCT